MYFGDHIECDQQTFHSHEHIKL